MGDSGSSIYTGRNDPLERERRVIQEGQVMAKGTKIYRIGATGTNHRTLELEETSEFPTRSAHQNFKGT